MARTNREIADYFVRHLVLGTAGGFVLGGLALITDLGGLATAIFGPSGGPFYFLLLFFGLFCVFGSLGLAVGMVRLARKLDDEGRD